MEINISSKKQYPTGTQKSRLIALLESDDELRQGKFSSSFTKKVAETRWRNIAAEVNSIPGAKKEWREWRKCWQDMKSKCKKKNALIRRAQTGTGGGPPPPTFTPEEEEVLRTISTPMLTGHEDCQESVVIFKDITNSRKPEVPLWIIDSPPETVQNESSGMMLHPISDQEQQQGQEDNKEEIDLRQQGQGDNKEGIESQRQGNKGKSKKRLLETIDIAHQYKDALKEKNIIKKKFYDEYIQELRRQTNALEKIAEYLTQKK